MIMDMGTDLESAMIQRMIMDMDTDLKNAMIQATIMDKTTDMDMDMDMDMAMAMDTNKIQPPSHASALAISFMRGGHHFIRCVYQGSLGRFPSRRMQLYKGRVRQGMHSGM